MPLRVIYDANILYPNTLRDILIRVAQEGLAQARWTEKILDEMQHALIRNRPDIAPDKLLRLRELMIASVRDCLVDGYEPLIEALSLPDKDDRHVLAAAITCRANTIVTFNLKDFPTECLAPFGIEAWSPDEFLLEVIDRNAKRVWGALQRIADSRRNPPETIEDVLAQLEQSGLIEAAAALRLS